MPSELTNAEIAEFNAKESAAQPAPAPSVFQSLSGPELAELSVKDPTFDLHSEFLANKDLWKDPTVVQNAIDAHNALRVRGFKFSDLPGPAKIAGQVVDVAKGFGKQILNSAKLFGDPLTAGMRGAKLTSGAPLDEATLEAQRGIAENAAGTEASVAGLSSMAQKAARKLFGKNPANLTPQEKSEDFWNSIGETETAQDISKGHGAFLSSPLVGSEVVKSLEEAGKPVRPEEVAQTAAGDPLAFFLFGKAFQGAGMLAKAGGNLAAAAAPETAAVLSRAGQAAGDVAARVGGGLTEAAGNVISGVGKAASSPAVTKVILPVAGAVKGVALGGPFGLLGGIKAGEVAATTSEMAGKKVLQPLGEKLTSAGEQISGAKPMVSPYAQIGKDVLEAAPGAAVSAAQGAATDIGLAAISSESPQDTAGVGLGTVIGGLHGLGKIAGHVVSGQIIAPRAWGSDSAAQASSGQFPALDAVHAQSITDATPGQAQRVNSIRQFAKTHAPGTDIFLGDPKNPAALQDALTKVGLPAEWANNNGFFSKSVVGADGQPHRVIILTTPDAAPHEAFHAVQDVLGEAGNQAVDALVKREYGANFDTQGNLYAQRLNAGPIPEGKTWQEVIADKSGWGVDDAKEKLIGELTQAHPDATPEDLRKFAASYLAEKPWTEALTPEEIKATGERYMARELAAENFDAAFKRGLKQDTSIPGRLAGIAANVIDRLGGNPIAGRVSETGTPLSFKTVEATKAALPVPKETVGTEAAPTAGVMPIAPTPKTPVAPVAPAAPTENPDAEKLRKAADNVTVPNAKTAIQTIADAVDQGKAVQVVYHGAEGEPGGSIGSVRPERRAEIEAARSATNLDRPLVRKSFTPLRLEGKQILGYSPDNFYSNANKLATWAEGVGDAAKAKIPYEIKNGQFTEQGWKDLQADLATFQHNQAAGATGAGEGIVLPSDVTARGFTQPTGESKPVSLGQDRADVINYLFHAQIPETVSRVAPLHLAGQKISEATVPGRTSIPARPRGEYSEAQLTKAGINGPRGVREVNPFRQWVERASASAGESIPSLIDVSQRLNLDRIADAQIAPEVTPVKGNILTLAAGFQPKEFSVKGRLRGEDKELKITAEDMPAARRQAEQQGMRIKSVTPTENAVLSSGQFQPPADPNKEHVVDAAVRMPTGEVFSGSFHGDAMKKALDAGHLELDTAKDGFITSTGRFVDRNEAFNLATQAGQVTPESLQKRGVPAGFNKLESTTFQEARQFQPIAERMDDPKTWEEIKNFKGDKYGGGPTGWAFDQGLHATPESLADYRTAYEHYQGLTKEAMASKDYMKAQTYSLKGQLAHEAYQFATGERLDGKPGGTQDFIRKHYDPNFTPHLAPKGEESAQFQPTPSELASDIATEKAEKYFAIGHENAGSKPWIFQPNGRFRAGKPTILDEAGNEISGSTHGSAFTHAVAGAPGTFKGWIDPQEKTISVVTPDSILRELGKSSDAVTVDDLPNKLHRALTSAVAPDKLDEWKIVAFQPREMWLGSDKLNEAPEGHEAWIYAKFPAVKRATGEIEDYATTNAAYKHAEKEGYNRVVQDGDIIYVKSSSARPTWGSFSRAAKSQLEDLAFKYRAEVRLNDKVVVERPETPPPRDIVVPRKLKKE